jgi:DNA-binding response OmpR family regulator
MKILILEDNDALLNVMKLALSRESYKVDCFTDGQEALNAIANGYSCFILDINVPSIDGIEVLKYIKSSHPNVPVIIISSNHELEKIQSSYEKGCNDYIKKPFFMYELVHKVKNLCKVQNKYIVFNENIKYDFIDHVLYENDQKIVLAKKEILFLELFCENINKVVSYSEIDEYVWEGEPTNLDNIRALIKRLRKKIPSESIKIVTGIGYTLNNVYLCDK